MDAIVSKESVKQACTLLLDFVNDFYRDPKNKQAFEAWNIKEANLNDYHSHFGPDGKELENSPATG